MKQQHYGFSFIEIIIALLLSSVLSLVLYAALGSTVRVTRSIDARVYEIATFVPLYNQLEKDITGMFGVPASNAPEKPADQVVVDKNKDDKKVTQWCVATYKDSVLDTWTFLTTQCFVGYNEVRPHCVRVVYRCITSSNGLMQLQREESSTLKHFVHFDEKDEHKGFVILDNIKQLEILFFVRKNEDGAVEKALEYESSTQWNSDERLKNKKMPLPEYVEFFAVCKDTVSDAEYEIRYRFWCCSAVDLIPRKEQAPAQQQQSTSALQLQKTTPQGVVAGPQKRGGGNSIKPVQQPAFLLG